MISIILRCNFCVRFVRGAFISCIAAQILLRVCLKNIHIRVRLGSSLLDENVCLRCAHTLIFHQISHQKSNTVQHHKQRQITWTRDRTLIYFTKLCKSNFTKTCKCKNTEQRRTNLRFLPYQQWLSTRPPTFLIDSIVSTAFSNSSRWPRIAERPEISRMHMYSMSSNALHLADADQFITFVIPSLCKDS